MPRRPRKQLGSQTTKKGPGAVKKTDGKIKKWATRDDVEGDEEDQFHDIRDKILLEGENPDSDEGWDDDEEVFGLGLSEESDDEDENARKDTEGDPSDQEVSLLQRKEKKKTKKTLKQPSPSPSPSESDADESESWGKNKSAYYASNADVIASKEGEEDEEEANEMEEREARRLQARMRDDMLDEDYGLSDVVDLVGDNAHGDFAVIEAKETSTAVPETIDKVAALHRLEKTSPETLALAREWDDVARELLRVQQRLDRAESVLSEASSLGLSHLHHQTLLTYVTVLAFYIHMCSSRPPSVQTAARVKPVLQRLLTLKQALSTMEDLDFDASSDQEDSEMEDDSDISDADDATKAEMAKFLGSPFRTKRVGFEGLEKLLRDADAAEEARLKGEKHLKPVNRTKDVEKKTHKKNKPEKRVTTESSFDLVEPKFMPTRRLTRSLNDDGVEAYGETTSLSLVDDADKKARKRTLRFHTSKIESSARRREEGKDKLGGDDDIPYRERKREQEERLRREVAKSRGQGGDDLDMDGITVQGPAKRKRDESQEASEEEGDDGYYDLVKRAKKEKKESKKRNYDESRMAERFDVVVEDAAGGPRSLTRAILKNKGLTPRRSKSVRNPRVKKRERYEKAKKKVSSQKAVYRPGFSGRPYGGEESGITKVVKSVKLA
ncbi:Sas10 C-terminal domain-containing protein [Hysterangium stoloniferum]|nr:Sas10 C-terminal domain-containing protein [Hysterangium stoloniferum]